MIIESEPTPWVTCNRVEPVVGPALPLAGDDTDHNSTPH